MNDRFINACLRKPVDTTPVWLMRQAGRYMAEYRVLREKYTILEIIKSPELAAEVTHQPLQAFDLDAAIIFADILTLPEAMGLELEFIHGEGPIFHNPLRSAEDVRKLRNIDPAESLSFTIDAVRLVTDQLDGKLPLIGFTGAPFTVACYAIEGGASRHFLKTKAFMLEQPEAWRDLMERFAEATGRYLVAQAEAGAAALQYFDSWAGILSPAMFESLVKPYLVHSLSIVRAATQVPVIYFGTDTTTLLPIIKEIGFDVVGLDWRTRLDTAWDILGPNHAVQGNLDPCLLFAPLPHIEKEARRVLNEVKGRNGHIFNLGHGILPNTPTDHVAALIDLVHRYGAKHS